MARAPTPASLAFAVLAIVSAENASASYIRMSPQCDISLDPRSSKVRAIWTVKNEGDEAAKDVTIDLPALNEGHLISRNLAAGQSASIDLAIPFEKLGIKERGTYPLIYRVSYRDLNLYPFSAAHLAEVVHPPGAARALVIRFDDSESGGASLAKAGRLRFTARNASDQSLTVTSLTPLFPLEIGAGVESGVPFELPPGGEKAGWIAMSNAGALIGSSYGVGIVASGTSGERRFTASGTLSLEIVEGRFSPATLLRAIIVAAAALVGLIWFLRRRRTPVQ